jgi:hypothetical protein
MKPATFCETPPGRCFSNRLGPRLELDNTSALSVFVQIILAAPLYTEVQEAFLRKRQ